MNFLNRCLLSITFFGITCLSSYALTPSRTELIKPIHKPSFNFRKKGKCPVRKQGGGSRIVHGIQIFNGSMDGNRQVDPQIAVGGGFVVHATNNGIIIYNKNGKYLQGVPMKCFNRGIDPKLFFCINNRFFCFDTWNPWDKAKLKPVNISVSETDDPRGAWNIYPVPSQKERDGGAIGSSRKWLAYTFPGGNENTFVMKVSEAKKGKPATIYHFPGHVGQPAFTRDKEDDIYFLKFTKTSITISRVRDSGNGTPILETVATKHHHLKYSHRPPKSPQRGTTVKTASGDSRPKNLVLQNGFLWFSHTVYHKGRAAVQWHQVKLDATIVQSGLLSNPTNSYIQTTLAVNKHSDVLIGFQETGKNMYISPRMAYRRAADPPGTMRKIIRLGEGAGPTDGVAWGDYSGCAVDGDNLLDLWTIQSITDENGKGDTVIALLPFTK
jgi:hypothetical protein